MIDIKQGENKFYVGDNQEEPLAEIHFVPTGATKLIVDHTYVSDGLRGQGFGEALVERIVTFAREEQKQIIPLCPFAKSQIDRHEEYQDVLKDRQN
ncbi:N-acetyltransferase [Bacillus sp. FJAT-49732]|uniref:N-acetyltransferase n=1 Tax=Lederbergia citrisecunda TaxID=2833583 RepID=A0A942YN66_9BACI|nr:GNAT family N-acetyltransferase [Lederbergia citrisecunda]MBS4200001.1 N-acetyltransferase [Lederbergia citrisecunda]